MEITYLQQMLQIILFVLFTILVIFNLHGTHKLFKLMKAVAPAYYNKIGKPTIYDNGFKRQYKGNFYMLRLFFGLPVDFPRDTELRIIAEKQRSRYLLMLLIWLVWAILAFAF